MRSRAWTREAIEENDEEFLVELGRGEVHIVDGEAKTRRRGARYYQG